MINLTTLLPTPIATLFNSMYAWYVSVASWVTSIKFITTNTASGSTSATLNTSTGLITYTGGITAFNVGSFTLTNSLITATSIINYNIIGSSGTGNGIIGGTSYKCSPNTITFFIHNPDSANYATPFKINYTIIG